MAKEKNKIEDVMNTSLALGLGLFDAAKKRAQKLVDELTENVSEQDKKRAVKDLVKLLENSKAKLNKTLRQNINMAVKELRRATRNK